MTARWSIRAAPWLFTLALLVIWELVCVLFNIPVFFLPPPTTVARAIVDYWPAIQRNSLITLWATLIGFGMAVGFGLLVVTIIVNAIARWLVWRTARGPAGAP